MSKRIAIAWAGLPFYAARLIKAGIDRTQVSIEVVGSKPSVPIEGMEETLGQTIHWINSKEPQAWDDLKLPIPVIFFHTGWSYPGFNTLAQEVREKGGYVISMIDNRWKNSFRQWVGALIFRVWYRRRFDSVWVPGKSGRWLCRFLGMQSENIYMGLYGADPEVFTKGPPLQQRKKEILFVGQLIRRKGVDILIDAFRKFRSDYSDWTLRIVGEGKISVPENEPGVQVYGFLQPWDLAREMRKSRFLVLPSREDHWGLVVHEAALSGCALIASDNVGAAFDLITPKNGIIHKSNSVKALEKAMRNAACKSHAWLSGASKISRKLAGSFGPETWAKNFEQIVYDLLQKSDK